MTRLGGRCRHTASFEKSHRLLIAAENKPLELWDTETGKRIAVLEDLPAEVGPSEESPDGKSLLIASDLDQLSPPPGHQGAAAKLFLREAGAGRLVREINVDISAAKFEDTTDWTIQWFDPNRLFLNFLFRSKFHRASASFHSVLGLLELPSGKVLQMSELLPITQNLLSSPDGRLLIDGNPPFQGVTHQTNIIDADTFKMVATLDRPRISRRAQNREHRIIVKRAWSPDSSKVATAGDDGDIGIWQPRTGKLLCSIDAYPDWIESARFSPDSRKLLTTSQSDSARVWDVTTGRLILTLSGHTASLHKAVFDAKGERILTASEDGTARLWDAHSGKMLRVFVDDRSVVAGEFLSGDKQIRTRNELNVERVWSVADGSRVSERTIEKERGHYGVCFVRESDTYTEIWVGPPRKKPPVPAFAGFVFYPSGKPFGQLATPRRELKGHTDQVLAMAMSRHGKLLASGANDKTVILWDIEKWNRVTGEGRRRLVHGENVECIAFTPNGRVVAAGGEAGTIKLWDTATGQEIRALAAHTKQGPSTYPKGVQGLAFSIDGHTLVSGGGDFTVKVWDWTKGSLRKTIKVPSPVGAVAVSPDGKMMAYDCGDTFNDGVIGIPHEVKLYDLATQTEARILKGAGALVHWIRYTNNGLLTCASFDDTIRFWPLGPGGEPSVFKEMDAHGSAVSQDGRVIASSDSAGPASGVVKLIDSATAKELWRFPAEQGWIGAVAFSPDGKTLYTTCGGRINVWDVGELLQKYVTK